MRPAVLTLALLTAACAAATPQTSCGCLPPRPDPVVPTPTLSPEGEVMAVIQALEVGCGGQDKPDHLMRSAQGAGWLRIEPAGEYTPCTVGVEGPAARIAAVDEGLLDHAEALDLMWNVRDSYPLWEDGRRLVRRVRGGGDKPLIGWTFTEFEAPTEETTTLTASWGD